jgi:hypothetical protein
MVLSPEERRITAEDDIADDTCEKILVSQNQAASPLKKCKMVKENTPEHAYNNSTYRIYLDKKFILTFLFLIQPFPEPKSRSVADPGCLSRIRFFFPSRIPDPRLKRSWIRIRIKEFKNF